MTDSTPRLRREGWGDHHPAFVIRGVEQLLAPRDILDPAFRQYLDSLTSAEAKAAEIEHAIRHEIHVHRDENPAAYISLWEQVEKIVNERREARVSAASALAPLAGHRGASGGRHALAPPVRQWAFRHSGRDPAVH